MGMHGEAGHKIIRKGHLLFVFKIHTCPSTQELGFFLIPLEYINVKCSYSSLDKVIETTMSTIKIFQDSAPGSSHAS